MITIQATADVEYNEYFEFAFSGAQGVVSATASLGKVTGLTVNQEEGSAAGTVSGQLSRLAITGSTVTLTLTDTYEVDEVETTDEATCTITVTTSGIITDLDAYTDVFARQQALCDNQVVIAGKINTVRNTVIATVVAQVASLATTLTTVLSELGDVERQISDLPSTIVASGKTTIPYGR